MRFGQRIVLGAPQARRMVFAADRRRVAVAAVDAAVDEETALPNAIDQIGDGAFGCRADLVGKSFAAVRRRDQRPVGPARRNVVKIRLDSLWQWLEKLLLGPALREHVIEGWLQSLAAHGGADQILVLGCPVCTEFEFIVDYPQSVVFSVDTVHAAAD